MLISDSVYRLPHESWAASDKIARDRVEAMERVLRLTTFEEDRTASETLAYWLSRTPEERIAEVERLRREYMIALRGAHQDGCPEGLCGPLLLVERQEG